MTDVSSSVSQVGGPRPMVNVVDLEGRVRMILIAAGLDGDDATRAAGLLVFAQRSGNDSHGVMHLPAYVRRLLDGTIKARPKFLLEKGGGATAVLDADDALGCLAAWRAMEVAIDLARRHGIGSVAVRRSSHFGVAAPFVLHAADQGMIAIICSNASATMAPWGGREALLGTNPLAAAFPRAGGDPVLIDMATSAGSRAVIRKAARAGETIPKGWALDAAGRPTMDSTEALAGTVQPIGGAKGSALSLMIELLCSALAGGGPGFDIRTPHDSAPLTSNVSHFVLVIDPSGFAGADAVATGVAEVADAIEASAPVDPKYPVRVPGMGASTRRRERDRNGVVLTAELATALDEAERLTGEASS